VSRLSLKSISKKVLSFFPSGHDEGRVLRSSMKVPLTSSVIPSIRKYKRVKIEAPGINQTSVPHRSSSPIDVPCVTNSRLDADVRCP
jgi:hypothetical protein